MTLMRNWNGIDIPLTPEEEAEILAAWDAAQGESEARAAAAAAATQARAATLAQAESLEAGGDLLGALLLRISLMPGWPPQP